MLSYRINFMSRRHSISTAVNRDCSADDEARQHALDLPNARPHDDAIAGHTVLALSPAYLIGRSSVGSLPCPPSRHACPS